MRRYTVEARCRVSPIFIFACPSHLREGRMVAETAGVKPVMPARNSLETREKAGLILTACRLIHLSIWSAPFDNR